MRTVRVTAIGMNIGQRVYSHGDRVAVPDDLAQKLVADGSAVLAEPEQPAQRRERAARRPRETR